MMKEFREQDLIVDDDVSHYDGTTAVVRPRSLPAREVEFLRWRAERWMKLRHLPAVFRHSPRFVLQHAAEMFNFTFAGSSWRSVLGLESQRIVFERFRAVRARSGLSAFSRSPRC